MSAPTLADRILAALSREPMTETDLQLEFGPRIALDAIRVKLVELKRSGRVLVAEGVWRLAAGVITPLREPPAPPPPRAPASAAAAAPSDEPAPASAEIPHDTQVCVDCERDLPMHEFPRTASGGRKTVCRVCCGKRIAAAKHRKAAAELAPPAPHSDAFLDETRDAAPSTGTAPDEPSFVLQPGGDLIEGQPLARVRRTWTLTVRDAFGMYRSVVLDEEGRRATLDELQEPVE